MDEEGIPVFIMVLVGAAIVAGVVVAVAAIAWAIMMALPMIS